VISRILCPVTVTRNGVVIIYLALTLLSGSSDLPAPWRRAISCFWSKPEATGPIWSCSKWGLPGHGVTTVPVSSYLAFSPLPRKELTLLLRGGVFSVALSVLPRFPGRAVRVTDHPALWSSDFPPLLLSQEERSPHLPRPLFLFHIVQASYTGYFVESQ